MKIQDILAKVAKGESLNDDEKKFLAGFDLQKLIDDGAAAARRVAEGATKKADEAAEALKKQLDDLQKKLDDATKGKMTDAEKAKADQDALLKRLADLEKKYADKEAEAIKLTRQSKVDEVIRGSGIQFVKEVDGKIMTGALAAAFAGVKDDELGKPDVVKPILEAFRSANKAVIVDASGHGSGTVPGQRIETGVATGKPIDQMTPAERQEDLKKRGVI